MGVKITRLFVSGLKMSKCGVFQTSGGFGPFKLISCKSLDVLGYTIIKAIMILALIFY